MDLLPCPFCGAKAKLGGKNYGWWFVSCSNSKCESIVGSFVSDKKAAEIWNTRIESPRIVEALRLLNEAVEIMTEDQLSQWTGIRAFLETVK